MPIPGTVTLPDGTTIITTLNAAGYSIQVIAPAGSSIANANTIQQNLQTQLAQIEMWITNNPAGAALGAGQTLLLAQMMAGVVRFLLGITQSVGGS